MSSSFTYTLTKLRSRPSSVNKCLRRSAYCVVRWLSASPTVPEFNAGTVGEALSHLTTQYADLRKHLFTEDGRLRSFVNVYVNDEDIRYLAKENTPTKDGDTISIIPSIAGGGI